MDDLLLHPLTAQRMEAAMQKQPHALIVSGPTGSGKKTLAFYLASRILETSNVGAHPYFLQILPTQHTITIESIRRLRGFLERRTIGKGKLRRVVLVGDAHLMSEEAQNALLKSLEEPPEDTMIILTSSDIKLLKPTILSRTYNLHVEPISKESALKSLAKRGIEEARATSAYYMSAGRAGLLSSLLDQKEDHPLVKAINQAKELVRLKPFERLVQAEELSKDKQQLKVLLEGFARLASSGLEQSSLKRNDAEARKFHAIATHVQHAVSLLQQNANPKLLLTDLFLKI